MPTSAAAVPPTTQQLQALAAAADHPLRHVAVIMDGNNRWALQRGLRGAAGHEAGAERIRDLLKAARLHGVETVTLFAFSSENWNRSAVEVRALMALFSSYLKREAPKLAEDDVRLRVIGNRKNFSKRLCEQIEKAEQLTAGGRLELILAVDYGGRWEIADAARQLAVKVERGELGSDAINETLLGEHLQLPGLSDPDLCIRTAGEQRISNFLLWQLAYSELYFASCYWPDFDLHMFERAVAEYYSRQRRFGGRDSSELYSEASISAESVS